MCPFNKLVSMGSLTDQYKHLWSAQGAAMPPQPQMVPPVMPTAPPAAVPNVSHTVVQTPAASPSEPSKMRVMLVVGTVVLLMYVMYRAFNKPSQTDVIKEKNVDILEKLRAESQQERVSPPSDNIATAAAQGAKVAKHNTTSPPPGDVTFEPIEEATEAQTETSVALETESEAQP